MLLNVYCVGGTLNAPDNFVGTAHDIRTAISLLRLLRAHECVSCKLQGSFPGAEFKDITALTINDALMRILAALLDADESAPIAA